MEGPTPVSALIHAATMVAAGVYMLCRVFFILELSPDAMEVIAYIGIGTAAFAGVIAVQQNDIKRILAYSTLSQLGYMVAAVGVGSPDSAMFHLTTHAFFKALLFLGSASVINAMHHEQDIWKMGGLFKRMKVTSITFLIGTLALAGCVPFAGFWSKEAILGAAYDKFPIVTWVGLITAGLTAFYMFRLMGVAFFSKERSDDATHTHESPAVMIVPLLFLAALAVVGGFFPIQHYVAGDVEHAEHHWIMYTSIGLFLVSTFAALFMYRGVKEDPLNIPLLANKFYFDEIYQVIFVNTQQAWARGFTWFDRWIVDGLIVRGVGAAATVSGEILRLFQGGNLQAYVILFILGAGGLFVWAALRFIL
jgi:NADH-quinone oxidoreductase subunit L